MIDSVMDSSKKFVLSGKELTTLEEEKGSLENGTWNNFDRREKQRVFHNE